MLERTVQILSCFNPLTNLRMVFVRGNDRFAPIDGLRAFSMLYVVITHAMVVLMITRQDVVREFVTTIPWYNQWVLMGDKGVDAFFVISGFLIGRLLMLEYQRSDRLNFKRFYLRRWLRLTPVYALFLGVWALFAAPGIDKSYLWAYLFYVNNFLDESHRYIPWLWSLAVEEQFYLVFPALLSLFFFKARQVWPFWVILYVGSLLIRLVIVMMQPDLLASGADLLVGSGDLNARYNQALYINLYTRFGPLVTGAFVAYLVVYKPEVIERCHTPRNQAIIAAAVVFIILGFLLIPIYQDVELPKWLYYAFHVSHRHVFAIMIALVLVMTLKPVGISRYISKGLGSRILFPFAQLSYSMYIFHLPVLYLTYEACVKSGWQMSMDVPHILVLTGVAMIPLTLLSLFVYIWVEAPFIRMREVKKQRRAEQTEQLCDAR